MRDYLSPARRVVERVLPQPAFIRNFVSKKRSFVFIMAASFVVITTLGFVTVRAMTFDPGTEQNVVSEEGTSSTLSTTGSNTGSAVQAESNQQVKESPVMTTPPSSDRSNESKTEVNINNERIVVPENGSVQRTIISDNGTTQVNVSTNSDSTVSNYSSSITTNSSSVNTSTNSSSQNINVTTQ